MLVLLSGPVKIAERREPVGNRVPWQRRRWFRVLQKYRRATGGSRRYLKGLPRKVIRWRGNRRRWRNIRRGWIRFDELNCFRKPLILEAQETKTVSETVNLDKGVGVVIVEFVSNFQCSHFVDVCLKDSSLYLKRNGMEERRVVAVHVIQALKRTFCLKNNYYHDNLSITFLKHIILY